MTEAALRQALLLTLPAVVGFILSFVVIGTYWRRTTGFSVVRNYDNRLVSINLRLLLCVSFIPCPTAFYSQYPDAQTPLISTARAWPWRAWPATTCGATS